MGFEKLVQEKKAGLKSLVDESKGVVSETVRMGEAVFNKHDTFGTKYQTGTKYSRKRG